MERQLSLFKGRRQRGVQAAPPREFAMHCMLADLLRRWVRPQWIWTHFPAGEERPAQVVKGRRVSFAGERLKRMGLSAGWPDFQFSCVDGHFAFLELKRRGSGRLSDEQEEIARHLVRAGHGYLVTDDAKTAIEWLVAQGILRGGVHVQ